MEDGQEGNRGWWRFFDGSVSVSASMLVAVLINECVLCGELPVVGFIKDLTEQESGVIIVATMLLFPVTLTLYGGANLIFAAKEASERRTRERLRKQREEGRKEGREEGRREVLIEIEKHGMLTPELARILDDEIGED